MIYFVTKNENNMEYYNLYSDSLNDYTLPKWIPKSTPDRGMDVVGYLLLYIADYLSDSVGTFFDVATEYKYNIARTILNKN